MVTLGILLVTVMGDGEQMFVLTQLVALIITAVKLAVITCQSQLAAVDYAVCILDGLLQTVCVKGKLGIGLGIGDICYLCGSKGIVTPYKIGTCQKCLGGLLGRYARITVVIVQE